MSQPPVAPVSPSSDVRLRELMAVREIAQALLTAERPADVYQLALDRVSPIVGATLACVYLVVDDSELMRLGAAYNWPARYAPFLGDMRVRLGAGPSGVAASKRSVVEVPDVFADASLQDWQEVANELGFRSLVALPLQTSTSTVGTVTFYFTASGALSQEGRGLLRLVADQMAATAEKARLIEDLQRTNTSLEATNRELERQNDALVEARRLQDEFLANVSHELRTPLTAVLGYLSLMEEGFIGPVTPEQGETLSQMKGSSEKLLALIGDLLELASLKRGEASVRVTDFDPREPVRDVVVRLEGKTGAVSLVVDHAPVLPVMSSDADKVARVLSALVGNAFKFTERGEVRLSIEPKGERVLYRISDTGIGIGAEAHEFIFDEFRQEDGSATRRYGGPGLGLALARRLARLLGGDITLSSRLGKGSTFVVELPLTYHDPNSSGT